MTLLTLSLFGSITFFYFLSKTIRRWCDMIQPDLNCDTPRLVAFHSYKLLDFLLIKRRWKFKNMWDRMNTEVDWVKTCGPQKTENKINAFDKIDQSHILLIHSKTISNQIGLNWIRFDLHNATLLDWIGCHRITWTTQQHHNWRDIIAVYCCFIHNLQSMWFS